MRIEFWGQFTPSTGQPPVVYAADARVVKAQMEVDHHEKNLAESPDCFGGQQLQETKLADARHRLAELQPRKPVALSASSVPKAGNIAEPPLQDRTAPSAAASSAVGSAIKEGAAERFLSAGARTLVFVMKGAMGEEPAPDLWRPVGNHLTTDVQMAQEGMHESTDAYLPSTHSTPAPALRVTAEMMPTSALPRDSKAWNSSEG